MSGGIVTTLEAVRTLRIDERRLAAAASPPNFLRRYEKRLATIKVVLGESPGRRAPHEPLYRLDSTAGVAGLALRALEGLMRSEEVERALQDVEAYCLSLVDPEKQGSLRSSAEDVANLAVEDAILYAVERFLRERAAARAVVDRRPSELKGWTKGKREAASQRAKRQHQTNKP